MLAGRRMLLIRHSIFNFNDGSDNNTYNKGKNKGLKHEYIKKNT